MRRTGWIVAFGAAALVAGCGASEDPVGAPRGPVREHPLGLFDVHVVVEPGSASAVPRGHR